MCGLGLLESGDLRYTKRRGSQLNKLLVAKKAAVNGGSDWRLELETTYNMEMGGWVQITRPWLTKPWKYVCATPCLSVTWRRH